MHFTNHGSGITSPAKLLSKTHFPLSGSIPICSNSVTVRIAAGEHAVTGGTAERILNITIIKNHTAISQGINMRSECGFTSIAAQRIRALLVR